MCDFLLISTFLAARSLNAPEKIGMIVDSACPHPILPLAVRRPPSRTPLCALKRCTITIMEEERILEKAKERHLGETVLTMVQTTTKKIAGFAKAVSVCWTKT
jgi:hypothetical protein